MGFVVLAFGDSVGGGGGWGLGFWGFLGGEEEGGGKGGGGGKELFFLAGDGFFDFGGHGFGFGWGWGCEEGGG